MAGSLARYLPFGGYWGDAPTQNGDGRGYTGQKENMGLGLMYYNARYYLPGIGKFASADTLVPDPTNPQQYNRYAYVLNNPIRNSDPSGHICYDHTAGPELFGTCFNEDGSLYFLTTPIPSIPTGPMIQFTGNGWSEEVKAQIMAGAQITGDALAEIINARHPHWNLSGEEAFKLIYHGSVTFNYTGGSCADDPRNTISICGARTEGRNLITVYTDADVITNKSHWAIHELGHAFVSAVGSRLPISLLTQAIAKDPLLDRQAATSGYYGFASDQSSPRLWQQSIGHAGTAHTEIWADMYLGWTSGTWEDSPAGQSRSAFMRNNMPLLVDEALALP